MLSSAFLTQPLAHRGFHDAAAGRPENSRASIRAAIDAGYGIEIDVQPSSDHVAMVFHDYELSRLAQGEGRIDAFEADVLARLPLRHGDEGIPTLAEVLRIVAGKVPVLIEIKDQDGGMGPRVGPLEKSVAADIRDYDGPLAVMSFNPHSVSEMARLAPDVLRGLTTSSYDAARAKLPGGVCARLRDIPDYDTTGSTFISHEWRDLARPRVADLKAQGAAILCWTVKSPAEEAEARKIAHNITFEQYDAPFPA